MKNKKTLIIVIIIIGALAIVGFTAKRMSESNLSGLQDLSSERIGYSESKSSMAPMSAPSTGDLLSEEEAADVMAESGGGETEASTDKKVIKNGSITMKVDRAEDAAGEISNIAKNNSGEVFSSDFYESSSGARTGNITVKVPVDKFETAYDEIKKVASLVVRESTSSQDVTEQYTDLQSRLKNKQAEEQSFVKILDQAGKIEDILKVTKELARVRGEIEVYQGRIKLLESQTDMATINISLSEDPEITVTDSWRPFQVLKDSVNYLVKSIQNFIDFIIVLVVRVIPVIVLYLILVLVAYFIGKRIYKRIKRKKQEEQQQ